MGAGKGAFYYNEKIPRMILGCTLAAALALTACSRSDSGSSGSMSTSMGGSSSQTGQAGQNAAYRTGLGILTEASDQERAGKIDTIAAAVLLDAEGRVADVMLDEVEISVTGDSTGKVTMPPTIAPSARRATITRWRRCPR